MRQGSCMCIIDGKDNYRWKRSFKKIEKLVQIWRKTGWQIKGQGSMFISTVVQYCTIFTGNFDC